MLISHLKKIRRGGPLKLRNRSIAHPGSPGWSEPPRVRRKSGWWERLLSGRSWKALGAWGDCCCSAPPAVTCRWFCGTLCTFSGGSPSLQATGIPIISGGVITGVTMTNHGTGFTSKPTVTFTDIVSGTGSGATGTAVLAGGQVTVFTIDTFGSGYDPSSPPAVTLTGSTITGGTVATGTAVVAGGSCFDPVVTAAGSGYLTAPGVTFDPAPAGGTTATGHTTIDAMTGAVTSLVMDDSGEFYTSTPAATIDAPPMGGTQATATVMIDDIGVGSITIDDPGSLYATAPTVTIDAPPMGGTTATATATIATVTVASVTITNGGSGYIDGSSVPTSLVVTLDSPGGTFGPFTLPFHGDGTFQGSFPFDVSPTDCWWQLLTTVDFGGNGPCDGASAVPFLVSIVATTSNVFVVVLALADQEIGPGCPLLDGFNNWCPDSEGSANTNNVIDSPLGSCSGRPYSSMQMFSFSEGEVAAGNVEALYFLFGGDCTGSVVTVTVSVSEP